MAIAHSRACYSIFEHPLRLVGNDSQRVDSKRAQRMDKPTPGWWGYETLCGLAGGAFARIRSPLPRGHFCLPGQSRSRFPKKVPLGENTCTLSQ